MKPQIINAGHDEQLEVDGASLPATMANPTANAARYRSVVRLYAEALGAGLITATRKDKVAPFLLGWGASAAITWWLSKH